MVAAPVDVRCEALSCEYARARVLHDVTFHLPGARVLALVGPNGAGKTTLLSALAGLHPAASGWAAHGGLDVALHPVAVRRRMGALLDFFGLYPSLCVADLLAYAARSRGVPARRARAFARSAAAFCGIGHLLAERATSLSRGWRQWVGIAQALVHRPSVLLLDEPASGLDPDARSLLAQRLRLLVRDHAVTVVVSSHILSELRAYADALLLLDAGRVRLFRADLDVGAEDLEAVYAEAMGRPQAVAHPVDWTPPA